jgi:hypothetical protein
VKYRDDKTDLSTTLEDLLRYPSAWACWSTPAAASPRPWTAERKAAGKFVDLMLPADPKAGVQGDEAFLIHFDREVELLEDFTNSRDKLHHELDGMGRPRRSTTTRALKPVAATAAAMAATGSGGHGGGTQLYDAIYLASDELMKPKSGRKALIVFSDGADSGSKETLNDAIDAADRANVQVFTIYFKGEEERHSGNGFPGRVGIMAAWAAAAIPVVAEAIPGGGGGGRHGGNPKSEAGVDGKKDHAADRLTHRRPVLRSQEERQSRRHLQPDRRIPAPAISAHYTPDKVDTDGEFHKIVLKTDKSDLNVITREGYYAPTPDK